MAEVTQPHPRRWVLLTAVLVLFSVWSSSFIAMSFLLGNDHAERQFDWVGLTVARYLVPYSGI